MSLEVYMARSSKAQIKIIANTAKRKVCKCGKKKEPIEHFPAKRL